MEQTLTELEGTEQAETQRSGKEATRPVRAGRGEP